MEEEWVGRGGEHYRSKGIKTTFGIVEGISRERPTVDGREWEKRKSFHGSLIDLETAKQVKDMRKQINKKDRVNALKDEHGKIMGSKTKDANLTEFDLQHPPL
ncbi:hypothetical protein CDAR_451281 [Caerostris darwini]|uniref:Uncharacterized protein n=1 Tax=Caerostris darwini TaxID=1538125 RepID=A0AAV4TD76_9ARAC|nr:hypothetical protein CDAR_451281 [Caerostris darwini]